MKEEQEYIPIFRLNTLSHILDSRGIVIDRKVYLTSGQGLDGMLEVDGDQYPLTFQGTIDEIAALDDLSEHVERRKYLDRFSDSVFTKPLTDVSGQTTKGFRMFYCIAEIVSGLWFFDPRVKGLPESDLTAEFIADLQQKRREEIISQLIGEKVSSVPKMNKRIRKMVEERVKEVYREGVADVLKESSEEGAAPYNLAFMKGEEKDHPYFLLWDNAYDLKPRNHLGNVRVRIGDKHYLFDQRKPFDLTDVTVPLRRQRIDILCREALSRIDISDIDSFRLYSLSKFSKNPESYREFSHEGAGLVLGKDGTVFVYVQPFPFAMHDIREGHEDEWMPFRNPPKLGLRFSESFRVSHDTSVYVEGEFRYFNCNSTPESFSTFCGSGRYSERSGESWKEAAVRCIKYGADTLMNGLTPSSMRSYGNGANYSNPIDSFERIIEAQALEEGLVLSNIHPTIMTNRGRHDG